MAKTTLDLPDDLMRAIRIRAAKEGRRLKDVVADVMRRGLASEQGPLGGMPRRVILPLVGCARSAGPEEEMAPGQIAELLMAEEAARAGS